MKSLKTLGFSNDLKTYIGRIPEGEFFYNWHMDRLFLTLSVWKKIIKFYTHINVMRIKNKNKNSSKIYVKIFV